MCIELCSVDVVEYFRKRDIVTSDTAKFKKTGKGTIYFQVGVILSPARESVRWAFERGLKRHKPLCSHFTKGCEPHCLKTSGQLVFGASINARILRTMLFINHIDVFLQYVERDLKRLERWAHKRGLLLVVRFDTLSDTNPEIYRGIMDRLGELTGFVDYTKDPGKYQNYLDGKMHPRHHLTFSRSETNRIQANLFVQRGGTATVVVRTQSALEFYLAHGYYGFPCVDGTISDRRWDDPRGHYVLLLALGKAKNDNTGFVVD